MIQVLRFCSHLIHKNTGLENILHFVHTKPLNLLISGVPAIGLPLRKLNFHLFFGYNLISIMRKSDLSEREFSQTRVSSKSFRQKPRKEGEQYSRNEKKKEYQRARAQQKRDF